MQAELSKLGLTEGEIKVYLALFELGLASKTPIAKRSGVSQSKVYEVLDRLIAKGIVSEITKNNVKHFKAEMPSKLREYVQKKKQELEDQEKIVEELIPQLKIKQQEPYYAAVFRGVEGLKTALAEIESQHEYLAMGVISRKRETYNRTLINWHKRRIKSKVPCRILFSEKGEYSKEYEKMKHTKARYLPSITPAAVGIQGDKVIIVTFKEELNTVLITSRDVADSFKQFFNSMWKIAK